MSEDQASEDQGATGLRLGESRRANRARLRAAGIEPQLAPPPTEEIGYCRPSREPRTEASRAEAALAAAAIEALPPKIRGKKLRLTVWCATSTHAVARVYTSASFPLLVPAGEKVDRFDRLEAADETAVWLSRFPAVFLDRIVDNPELGIACAVRCKCVNPGEVTGYIDPLRLLILLSDTQNVSIIDPRLR